MKYGYGYLPPRRRIKRWSWWLALPLALVIGSVILASRLPEGSNETRGVSAACETSGECPPYASAPAVCNKGGDCLGPQGTGPAAGSASPPEITGRGAAVLEEPCGALLYGLTANQRRPPASLTKITTALVALERAPLYGTVKVALSGAELAASTDSTVMGLEPGQQLGLRDLLYGLLLPSGNDAALAIATHVAGDVPSFVALMNAKAEQLGLKDTHFTNPHGLDDRELYTSAFDIAILGRELMRRPELAAIVGTRTYQPAWDGPPLWNSNRLLYLYPGSLGVKIGYTDEAGQTIVAAAEREGRRLIVSVLGSSDIYSDAIKLLDWSYTKVPAAC